jgi:hypothetical protein
MKLNCDKHICYFCGVRNPPRVEGKKYRSLVEVHHIKERNEGGDNRPDNLLPLCSNCHSKVHLGLIEIGLWYNVGYCRKLKWIDEEGVEHFGSFIQGVRKLEQKTCQDAPG